MLRRGRFPALCAVLALAACALPERPAHDDVVRQALPNLTPPAQWSAAGAGQGAVANGWLATYGDPQLEALVKEAIAYNADLRIAAVAQPASQSACPARRSC